MITVPSFLSLSARKKNNKIVSYLHDNPIVIRQKKRCCLDCIVTHLSIMTQIKEETLSA